MPTYGKGKSYGNSSKWLENADYFRCENISVAYTLPRSMMKFADVRLSFSAQNLFTITGYSGADPETASMGRSVTEAGIDYSGYPNPRTFLFGVNMSF